jgi:hypothetical protein
MHKLFVILVLILLLATSLSFGSSPNKTLPKTEEPQDVSFCELFKESNSHSGKLVRIKVVWKFGHSFSYIYAPKCERRSSTWITFDKEENLCEGTVNKLKGLNTEFYNETEVVAVGRLDRCVGGCGHSSAYDYKFVVRCLEQAEPIKVNKP